MNNPNQHNSSAMPEEKAEERVDVETGACEMSDAKSSKGDTAVAHNITNRESQEKRKALIGKYALNNDYKSRINTARIMDAQIGQPSAVTAAGEQGGSGSDGEDPAPAGGTITSSAAGPALPSSTSPVPMDSDIFDTIQPLPHPDDDGPGRPVESQIGAFSVYEGVARNRNTTSVTHSMESSQSSNLIAGVQDYLANARLVTEEENDAERLRMEADSLREDAMRLQSELDSLRSAPTAELVEQPKPRKLRIRGNILVFIMIVCIVMAVVITTRSSKEEDSGISTSESTNAAGTYLLRPVLETIQDRGYIHCYVNTDERKQGYGVSIELCRALSAAVFHGDPNRTKFTALPWLETWSALDNGTLDISTSHVTFNMRRDVYEQFSEMPKTFSAPWYFTGAVFAGWPDMVDCAERADTLSGACVNLVVCVHEGTTTNDIVQAHMDGSGIHLTYDNEDTFDSLIQGTCNVIAGEPPELHESFARQANYTGDYKLSSLLLSREPLAMATRESDPEWSDFANIVLQALFTAELEHITQQNASLFPRTSLFGKECEFMFQDVISAVGNWAEIYNRTFGLRTERTGKNHLVRPDFSGSQPGMLYSPPFSVLEFNPTLLTDLIVQVTPQHGALERIAERGYIRCGVLPGRPGFVQEINNESSTANETWDFISTTENATWKGLDVDLCRCLAAELFQGDEGMVEFVALDRIEAGYNALANDMVDLVAGIPYNLAADVMELSTKQGHSFSPPYFYGDGGERVSLVTRQTDLQWTDFVKWTIYALIHAEENGMGKGDPRMPAVDLFGPSYKQMFKFAVSRFGNYGDLYDANVQEFIPRQGYNMLTAGTSPLIHALPLSQFLSA